MVGGGAGAEAGLPVIPGPGSYRILRIQPVSLVIGEGIPAGL